MAFRSVIATPSDYAGEIRGFGGFPKDSGILPGLDIFAQDSWRIVTQ
jgi:hypothetical protein